MTAISLEPLDLAALLCSRVCHDVISPVGAIVNALEVLEEDDPSMRDFALELIKKSARNASSPTQPQPFTSAGLQPQDIILKINGKVMDSNSDVVRTIANMAPGTKVTLNVWRKGSTRDLSVTVSQSVAHGPAPRCLPRP